MLIGRDWSVVNTLSYGDEIASMLTRIYQSQYIHATLAWLCKVGGY